MDKCSRCGQENSEYKTFSMSAKVNQLKDKVTLNISSWYKKLFARYLNILLETECEVEVKVCQSCVSKMLRNCDKDI